MATPPRTRRSLTGVPPIQYLTRWRMDMASTWMRDENLSVGEVATRLGYSSEASFSRAFKRHLGSSPGAYRRKHSDVAKRRARV